MKTRAFVILLAFFWSASAFADPAPGERVLARSLFDEGRKLAQSGSYTEACPKLEESQRLDPGMGTLFNLADCWEHTGRLASAWSAYLEVADQAKRSGQPDRERAARARAAAIDPRVPRLVIVVKEAGDIKLSIDGTEVHRASLDMPLPVDPGDHVVEATAPGKRKTATKISVTSGTANVEITMLEPEPEPTAEPAPLPPAPPPPADAPPPREPPSTWHRPAALITAGTGALALGAGVFFGLRASSTWSDGKKHCTGSECDPEGVAAFDSARSDARIANVAIGVGAAAIIAGAVFWFLAPSQSTRVGFTGTGVVAAGRFQ